MKRWIYTIGLLCLILPGLAFADVLDDLSNALKTKGEKDNALTTEAIDFSGRLINYGPTISIGKTDVTGVTNFRWFDNGVIGSRSGMSGYTTNAVPSGYDITNIFALNFENAPEIWAVTQDTSGTSIYDITSGTFSTVSKYQTSGVSTQAKITSALVRDTFLMADGDQITAYSGASVFPTALLEQKSGSTVYIDRYDWIFDGDSHSVATGNTIYAGYSRPFDKLQASSVSAFASHASSVTEYFYNGKMRYWTSFQVGTGGSTFQLPKIETSPRELGTNWDGLSWQYAHVFQVQLSGASETQDYSLMVADESEETYADLSSLESGGTVTMGFPYKPRLIHVNLPEEFKNSTVSSISPYYWNGSANVVGPSFSDGTSHNGIALAQTGTLDFDKITDWEPRKVGQSLIPYYTLDFKVSTTISNYVRIFKVAAIPDYDSPSSDGRYRMVAEADGRLMLANGRDLSKVLISAKNQPDVFIGADTADEDNPLFIGKREPMIWMGQVGENKYFLKKTQSFGMIGVNPSTWQVLPITGKPPCVSTSSVIPIQIGESTSLLYASSMGIYDLLGTGIPLSRDISAYWEPGNDKQIAAADLDDIIGWYDPDHYGAHFLIPRTRLELVYDLIHKKWSVDDRNSAVALTTGVYLVDNDNNRYHLGAGANGRLYYLEQGTTDGGYQINSEIEKPPMVLNGGGLAGKSELRAFALRYELPDGTTMSGGSVYLTASISDNAATYQGSFSLDEDVDGGFHVVDRKSLTGAQWGFNYKFRFVFPSRINLQAIIIKSKEASGVANWP